MLEIESLRAGYNQGDVLFDLSLNVARGEVLALLGRNGAGKSTTLKSVIGLVRPSAGRITFKGQDLNGLPTHAIARLGVGYVPEERRIFPRLTVEENLMVTRTMADGARRWTVERVYKVFPILAQLRHRRGGKLSGGEQQMLAVARTLMGGPEIILLDEPSEGLAPLIVQELARQIKGLKDEGITILLSEQNMSFARALSDRVCVLDKGILRFTGTLAALEADASLKRAHLMVAAEKVG